MNNIINFKSFLKKYSNLSNSFIDDFHNIYDYDELNNIDFVIDLIIITKWLNVSKGNLKQILINKYIENVDYIVKKIKSQNKARGGHNEENIMVTPECFKRLCMLSNTEKGEEVRTYYIELEKLLNHYRKYIIEALQKTVDMLENNQKEIPENIKSTVYVLKSPKDIDGLYRFGKSEDFKKRLANYNSANSDKMEVMYIYETKDAKVIEDCVISQIKKLRYKKRKDFYEIDLKLLKKIIIDCNNLTLKYKKRINKNIKKNNENQDGGINYNLYLYIQYDA